MENIFQELKTENIKHFVHKINKYLCLQKFCFMFDLVLGVKYFSFLMVLLWGTWGGFAISSINTAENIYCYLTLTWIVSNISAFVAVAFGLDKNIKILLVPALVLCPLAVIISSIIVLASQSIYG